GPTARSRRTSSPSETTEGSVRRRLSAPTNQRVRAWPARASAWPTSREGRLFDVLRPAAQIVIPPVLRAGNGLGFASAARVAEAAGDLVPVDDVPPGGEVVGPPVLVLEVVGVLPHVDPEERHVVVGLEDRAVLVRSRVHGEPGAVPDEPAPAGAEALHAGLVHELLQRVEGVEGARDRVGQRA